MRGRLMNRPCATSRPRPAAFAIAVLPWIVAWHVGATESTTVSSTQTAETGPWERVWDVFKLYENEENSVVQKVALIGRYQGQYWVVDASQGNANDWENRRMYVGAEAFFFRQFRLHAQVKFNEDFDPVYGGLYQAYVAWEPNDAISLMVGRLDFLFAGLERSVSSTKIVTFERGLLSNQLLPSEIIAAVATAEAGKFSYRGGVYSGTVGKGFSDFDAGFGAVAGVGYELPLFFETGSIHLDYVFGDGHEDNDALSPYDHTLSLWHQGQAGPFGLGLELTGAHGLEGRPAVFGVTILPTYVFARDLLRDGDALQAVLRWQFAVSDGDNGLELQKRYEQEIVPNGFGNRYQAIYGGINYLIFGDRCKLMTGVEYSDMKDSAGDGGAFDGWTFLTGVRVSF
jgi:phosphate-selective porin OprO and OprP